MGAEMLSFEEIGRRSRDGISGGLVPSMYTSRKGGEWIDWPDNLKFKFDWLSQRSSVSVKMDDISVHSIAFECPLLGIGNFLQWNCMKGFE